MKSHECFALLIVCVACCAAVSGCGKSGGAAKRGGDHVRRLTNLYALVSSKLGHTPRDEDEFKKTLATQNLSLDRFGVTSLDELFVSERDGKPLVVVYGQPPKGSDVVVYEQIGVGGKRQVGHRIGMVEELDEAQLKDLIAAPH